MKTQIGLLNRIGFWSAILTTVWTIWFIAAFGFYMSSLPSEWPGIEVFAASFDPVSYIAWVGPCLLLALTFPVMMSSIYFYASDDKKLWGLLGLVFAVMYRAVLATNYWLITRHIRFGLPAFALWKLPTTISYMPKHCPKFRTHIIKSKKSVSHER